METVEKTKSKIGIVSFVLGIIGLMAGVLPIIGAFVTIAGLVLGIKGHSLTYGHIYGYNKLIFQRFQ